MKPLQHAQISAKTYGGSWTDYSEVHNFLDSSKATCAHFKHRFLLYHAEGIEFGVRIFGETLKKSENQEIQVRQLLTDHLIEDVGRVVSVEDWARENKHRIFLNLEQESKDVPIRQKIAARACLADWLAGQGGEGERILKIWKLK